MEIIFENFGKVLLLLIWIICGIYALINKDSGAFFLPVFATIGWLIAR